MKYAAPKLVLELYTTFRWDTVTLEMMGVKLENYPIIHRIQGKGILVH